MNVNEDESSDSHSDNKIMDTQDGHSSLTVHQSSEKWENLYPFLFFSSSKNGWLCTVSSEYGEGDEFWRKKGVQQGEHPNRKFSTHEKSKKHTSTVLKCAEVKCTLSKGSAYKQIYQRTVAQNQKTKKRNRHIIKKFFTLYFLTSREWVVWKNFEDVIKFLND